MWRLRESILGENEEQQDNLFGDQEALCSISPLQRVYGFSACLLAGLICMLLSMIVFIKPIKFALLFTFGNMLAIGRIHFYFYPAIVKNELSRDILFKRNQNKVKVGLRNRNVDQYRQIAFARSCPKYFQFFNTAFLIGPMQQLSMMMDPVRAYATSMYVGCVVLALICALLIHSKILTLLAIICEICALTWYSLSYIPFARRMVSNVTVRLFDTEI